MCRVNYRDVLHAEIHALPLGNRGSELSFLNTEDPYTALTVQRSLKDRENGAVVLNTENFSVAPDYTQKVLQLYEEKLQQKSLR